MSVEYIDLYYLHQRDETVPLEDAIGTLVDLMKEGKIGGYGLTEVAPYTLRLAQDIQPFGGAKRIFPLDASELGMIQACRDLGVAFVPFPTWRAVFLGKILRTFRPWRKQIFALRFRDFNPCARNITIIDRFKTYATDRGLRFPPCRWPGSSIAAII